MFQAAAISASVRPASKGDRKEVITTQEKQKETRFTGVASAAAERWMKEMNRVMPMTSAAARYKTVDKKVKPIPGVIPDEARTIRRFPSDPLEAYKPPPIDPPPFEDGNRVTRKTLDELKLFVDGFLSEDEIKIAEHILREREDAIAFDESQKGRFRPDYFSDYVIPTKPHIPWQQKPIPIPKAIREEVSEMFLEKIKNGTYERSQSSYCSKWFVVFKKSGKFRIVHDLQPLNAVTIRDAGVPPNIEEFVEDFAGRAIYSLIDIFVGYDNRTLHPDSRDMTAFMSPDHGLLRLTVLPQGGANCVPEFQACMCFILQDEIPKTVGVFIDDVGIKGGRTRYELEDGSYEMMPGNKNVRRFVYEHLCDLDRVLTRIGHSGATAAAHKLAIVREEVVIVGQKVNYQGRLPDDSKVSKIINWPTPGDQTSLRGFLGTATVVRMFIKDFGKIARPLNDLLRKGCEWAWTERCQKAMDELKSKLISPPCLTPIDYDSDREVILAVDSSKYAVGYVLMQLDDNKKRLPALYGSLTFNERESRYSQPKLELYGLFRALRKLRLQLFGIKNLVVEIDASYIKGMLNSPDTAPNATFNRWIEGILLYQPILRHVPATSHTAADGLSRRARSEEDTDDTDSDEEREREGEERRLTRIDEGARSKDVMVIHKAKNDDEDEDEDWSQRYIEVSEEVRERTISQTQTAKRIRGLWSKWLEEEQEADFDATRAYLSHTTYPKDLAKSDLRHFIEHAKKFFIKDEQLYRRDNQGTHKLVPRKTERGQALAGCHDKLGHKGVFATESATLLRFWWPGIRQDVETWVKTCVPCQMRSERKIRIPVKTSVPPPIMSHFLIDCCYMPRSTGFRYVVAARDDTTGWMEARRLKRATGATIARFIWEELICRWGAFDLLTTDNGPEFIEAGVKDLLAHYDVEHISISPYNSRAAGIVERGHRTFREALLRSTLDPAKWADMFYHALWAERVTTRVTTGYSPFYLVHGYHPTLPIDLELLTFAWDPSPMTHEELVAHRAQLLAKKADIVEQTRIAIAKSRWKSAERWNQEHKATLQLEDHLPGELVVVRNSRVETDLGRKSKPRWLGPFVIVRRTVGGAYVLAELNGAVSKLRFAAFRVKKFHERKGLSFKVEDFLTQEQLVRIARELREEERMRREDEDGEEIREAAFARIIEMSGGKAIWGGTVYSSLTMAHTCSKTTFYQEWMTKEQLETLYQARSKVTGGALTLPRQD